MPVTKIFVYIYLPLFVLIYNANISQIRIFQSFDELLLALSLLVILINILVTFKKNKMIDKISLIFLIYLLYQIINYFFSSFQLNLLLVLAQAVINLKLFIITWATLLVYKETKQNNILIKKVMFLFIFLFFLGFIINLLIGSSWNILFNKDIVYRYDFIRPIGYYISTAHVGYFFVLTFFTFFMLRSKTKIIKKTIFLKKFFIFIIVDFLFAFILSTRKGMFINIPFGLFVMSLYKKTEKGFILIFLTLFLTLFLYLIKDMQIFLDTQKNILDMSNPETSYIRGLMIYHGVSLFVEFFPFGVGNATFGTVLSQYNTLDVYQYVGLDLSRIYQNNTLYGIYDSGLASMLAENGFIGIILIFSFIYYFFKYNKKKLDTYNYIIFKVLTIFTILLSLSEPNWQNGLFSIFYIINILYIYTKNNLYKEKGKWVKHET